MSTNIEQLAINTIRTLSIDAIEKAKSGHPGLPMGAAPMAYALFTDWDAYGRGRDERCANCMAHCGYEPTAVLATMGSLKESLRAARDSVGGRR